MPKKISKKKPQKASKLTKLLIVAGAVLITIPVIFYINQTIQLSYFSPKVAEIKSVASDPVQISAPDVKMNLPISETQIKNNVWQVASNGASHLNTSANPTEAGPIILYAHNTNNRFGPIKWLEKGNSIEIKTADGKTHTFTVYDTFETDPSDTGFISKINKETLVLYTCSGFADLKRYFVLAIPTN